MVGHAVTCTSPNGPLRVMKEMVSMAMPMAEMLQKSGSNPEIADLAAELKPRRSEAESNVLRQTFGRGWRVVR